MFYLKRPGRSASLDVIEAGEPSTDGGVLNRLIGLRYSEPTDPEYLALKTSLASLADILEAGLAHAKTVDASWARLCTDQAAFAATLQAADRKSPALRDGPGACAAFSKSLVSTRSNIGVGAAATGGRKQAYSHSVAFEQVRRYLTHVRALQARYRDLAKARTEFDGEGKKAAAARAKGVGGAGGVAALQKAEDRAGQTERMYTAMLRRMMERLRAAEGKKDDAVQMLNNAFWMQQKCIHGQMGSAEEPAFDAASATEPMLVSCNLLEGLAAPSQMFTALDTRPSALARRSSSKSDDSTSAGPGKGGGGGGRGHGVLNGSTGVNAAKTPRMKEPRAKVKADRRYGEMTRG